MLTRYSIGPRLGIAFASLVLLLVAATLVGLFGLKAVEDSAHRLGANAALNHNAAQLRRLALEQRRFEKDTFINLRDPAKVADYGQRWDATRQALADALDEGLELTREDALREHYLAARQSLEGYASGFDDIRRRIGAGELTDTAAANAAMGRYKNEIYRLDESAAAIDRTALERLQDSELRAEIQARRARFALLGFAVLALGIAALMALGITRSISTPLRRALEASARFAEGDLTQSLSSTSRDETGQLLNVMGKANQRLSDLVGSLRQGSDSVFARAHEVLSGSKELAMRTDEQVAALQQTAASMEQISANAQQTSDSTEQANALAATAARTAQSGGRDVEQSIQLMRDLAGSSQRINDIIAVIDSIAFQTNILALNASVEAARAGEQGRGFAVVAAEVRNLASRSATSAQEIRALIEDIGERIAKGTRQAEHSGKTIGEAVEAIHQLARLMADISAATREQRSGFEQINSAIVQLDGTTQSNATLVAQSRSAAAALEEQALQMQRRVAAFKTREQVA